MEKSERYKIKVAVYLILIKDGKLLMTRRANTGWQDGNWGLPAGHLEVNETLSEALIREEKEEIGIDLLPKDFELVLTMHRPGLYIDLFYLAERWKGEPKNMEPDKCDGIAYFDLNALPINIIPSISHAIDCFKKGERFTEFLGVE